MFRIAMLTASILAVASPAAAHVTVQPTESTPGAFARFVARVPNERPDAATVRVEMQFPDLFFVSFMDAPGWRRTVEMRELEEPAEVFGEQVTEVVGTVTWEGGRVEPGEFVEFGFSARMPENPGTLEFPAIQTYDSGEEVRWIGPPDSEEPAARVQVVNIGADEGQGQLAVIADLRSSVDALRSTVAEREEGSGSALPLILGAAGTALGGLALGLTLARKGGADGR